MRHFLAAGLIALIGAVAPTHVQADNPSYTLTLKDHRFTPEELTIPANTRVRLVVKNLDPTAAEFESKEFKVEKIIPPGKEVTINVAPLKPGTYAFVDEYHEDVAKGRLIVK